MLVLRGLEHFPADLGESVVALGTFDGVHRGHQEVLQQTVARARALGLTSLAVTFDPHPLQVLQPARAPAPIVSLEEKTELMALTELDALMVISFTKEFSLMEAEEFVSKILRGAFKAREVVVGFNHRFGKGARGDSELMARLAREQGFVAHVIPPLVLDGQVVSSSAIREALKVGDVRRARSLLGRPYIVTGRVLRGDERGKTIGFPTANLRPERALPLAQGVYAVRAEWKGEKADGVTNIGYRPTFGGSTLWIETYLLDFQEDLYDRILKLAFIDRIRAEQRFENVEILKKQIGRDVEAAKAILGRLS